MSDNKKSSAPLNDSIATALASLVGTHKPNGRESRATLTRHFCSASMDSKRLTLHGHEVAGKTKRVRTVLYWALEQEKEAGERLVAAIFSQVRGKGGFRPDSLNFVGTDAIRNQSD